MRKLLLVALLSSQLAFAGGPINNLLQPPVNPNFPNFVFVDDDDEDVPHVPKARFKQYQAQQKAFIDSHPSTACANGYIRYRLPKWLPNCN